MTLMAGGSTPYTSRKPSRVIHRHAQRRVGRQIERADVEQLLVRPVEAVQPRHVPGARARRRRRRLLPHQTEPGDGRQRGDAARSHAAIVIEFTAVTRTAAVCAGLAILCGGTACSRRAPDSPLIPATTTMVTAWLVPLNPLTDPSLTDPKLADQIQWGYKILPD